MEFIAKRAEIARAEKGLAPGTTHGMDPHLDDHDRGRFRTAEVRDSDLAALEDCGRADCPYRWRLRADQCHPHFRQVDLGRVADLSGLDPDRLRRFSEGDLNALDADEQQRRLDAMRTIAEDVLRLHLAARAV
jgi:hypothetical protein